MVETGTKFLIERAKLQKVTSYTELNTTLARRTGLREFDFQQESERAAMGHLLGLIVESNYPTTKLLITALVHYLDQNDAGPGFYALAQEYGLLARNAPAAARWEFWVRQVTALHRYYGDGSIRRS